MQTVLVVDDHPTFRRFARQMLEEAGFAVVGEAADGAAALAQARELEPDVVLLDVLLPDISGIQLAHALRTAPPRAFGRAHVEPKRRRSRRGAARSAGTRVHREGRPQRRGDPGARGSAAVRGAAWWLTAGAGIALAAAHASLLGASDGGAVEIAVALGGLLALAGRAARLAPPAGVAARAAHDRVVGVGIPARRGRGTAALGAAAATVGWAFAALNPVLYAQLVLSFPTGRLPDSLDRRFVLAAYALRIAWALPPLLFADPRTVHGLHVRTPSLLFTGVRRSRAGGHRFDVGIPCSRWCSSVLCEARFVRPAGRRTFGPVVVVASLRRVHSPGVG